LGGGEIEIKIPQADTLRDLFLAMTRIFSKPKKFRVFSWLQRGVIFSSFWISP
jgi:hypothetical protein